MSVISNRIASIAVGSFDGMHIAHQALIEEAEAVAVIERQQGYLTPGFKRSWYCGKPLAFYLFEHVRNLSADGFVALLMDDFPELEQIVVGYDFRFGRGKGGSPEIMKKLFPGKVKVIPEICVEGIAVHSRTIREYIKEGMIERANRMLGRSYTIDGEVTRGQGLGKKSFVPTLNLEVEDYQLPPEGVYAARTRWGSFSAPSVVFIGHRHTTDGSFAVETHLLDMDPGEPEGRVMIDLESMIRENRKYADPAALRAQIGKDIARARILLE